MNLREEGRADGYYGGRVFNGRQICGSANLQAALNFLNSGRFLNSDLFSSMMGENIGYNVWKL